MNCSLLSGKTQGQSVGTSHWTFFSLHIRLSIGYTLIKIVEVLDRASETGSLLSFSLRTLFGKELLMVQNESYAQISPTASLIAYERTFTDIPFAKEIAAACNAEEAAHALIDSLPDLLAFHLPRAEMRYKITNLLIAQRGITQVLEIAAGLSPRGLAMTQDPEVVYVTTDLPEIIGQSKAIAETILTDLDLQRPNLSFRAANALHLDELVQAAAPFRPDQPLAIVVEGLLLYLTRAEQAIVAANIHALLTTYNGVWITPDVVTNAKMLRWTTPNIATNAGMPQAALGNLSAATGSNFIDNTFLDQNDLHQFFTNAGFNIEVYPATRAIDELSLFRYLNLSREEELEIARGSEVFVFTI
jgi:hypothetical protein